MYFAGQPHITRQLQDILPYLYENKHVGMSMLFRGPSGWGKTTISRMICNYLTGGDYEECLGNEFVFNEDIRVHFIDEVHLLTNPEVLYQKMDCGKYVIIIATNDAAILLEALVNRCTEFIFNEYPLYALREICQNASVARLPTQFADYIIESGGNNPRIIKSIVNRLNIMVKQRPDAMSGMGIDGFKELLSSTFGIVDGMDIMCLRYMSILKKIGGRASVQTLATMLHIDTGTITRYIEPILLHKSLISITSKGRMINENSYNNL